MTAQTIATISTMPWTRLAAHQRRPYTERLRLLGVLARDAQWLDPAFTEDLLVTYAHDSLTRPQLDQWWATALERHQDAIAAEMAWDWRCPSCGHPAARGCDCECCPNAVDHARAGAAEALETLAGGIR